MVAVPGGLLGHGMACGLAREHTGVLVSVCEDILVQGSVFVDSYIRAVNGWCLGTGLDLDLLSSLTSFFLLLCLSVMCFWLFPGFFFL